VVNTVNRVIKALGKICVTLDAFSMVPCLGTLIVVVFSGTEQSISMMVFRLV
jgi:hypothetical protein